LIISRFIALSFASSSSSLAFVAQLGEFLLDLDLLEPRQLAQADLEDVLGLAVGQAERAISAPSARPTRG
jgi:hypothetical protein